MKEFHVEIMEILQTTVKIMAENREAAVDTARRNYDMGKYSVKDLVATEFDVRP